MSGGTIVNDLSYLVGHCPFKSSPFSGLVSFSLCQRWVYALPSFPRLEHHTNSYGAFAHSGLMTHSLFATAAATDSLTRDKLTWQAAYTPATAEDSERKKDRRFILLFCPAPFRLLTRARWLVLFD